LTFLASLLLRGVSFFVKKKRKGNEKKDQIELIVCDMNLIRIGDKQAYTQIKINTNSILEIGDEPVENFDRFKNIKHSTVRPKAILSISEISVSRLRSIHIN
jgi:hypothetical protein